jgi:hypothetical protein
VRAFAAGSHCHENAENGEGITKNKQTYNVYFI